MVTGDLVRTATMIAAELGITDYDSAVIGVKLENTSDEAMTLMVREVSVYARVNPAHKLRIARALQGEGHTVAMTGDKVNEAPALKKADIGVTMGVTGTDVSKEAVHVVLLDGNIATIASAVEEGLSLYSDIRKFLRYLLSSNLGEVRTRFFGVSPRNGNRSRSRGWRVPAVPGRHCSALLRSIS